MDDFIEQKEVTVTPAASVFSPWSFPNQRKMLIRQFHISKIFITDIIRDISSPKLALPSIRRELHLRRNEMQAQTTPRTVGRSIPPASMPRPSVVYCNTPYTKTCH